MKTLTDIKREAKNAIGTSLAMRFNPKTSGATNDLLDDVTFTLDRLVDEIEKAVVPDEKANKDWTKDEHGKKCVDSCTYCSGAQGMTDGFNSCRRKLVEAFTRFKGESHD